MHIRIVETNRGVWYYHKRFIYYVGVILMKGKEKQKNEQVLGEYGKTC